MESVNFVPQTFCIYASPPIDDDDEVEHPRRNYWIRFTYSMYNSMIIFAAFGNTGKVKKEHVWDIVLSTKSR